ncbi:GDSL-like Lipase/Acylhydrolase-domain-containing protein [Mucor mucedo]|uniref:GDSL-like Lipase/Acylhydrolase-domain-containing protein n=1 Tax=Mucor mucedo TaxID=29922 RepID=UPI0022206BE5|nr:GDSL-like Lipase/Acylhydrolase-domain-containing protein [Mucor mucedo]KAI7890509.1 GDSL-like Lipase/Acylhydrolase-domain-containing protein [Mucor mucedo]
MKFNLISFIALQLPVISLAATVKNLVVFGDSNSDVGNSQRWSDGSLWSEYLAAGWNASLYSFAYSGSVCDNAMFKSIEDKTPSLKDQMEAYYNLNLNLKPEETVYAFWFGVQDIFEMSKRHGRQEPDYKEILECIGQQLRMARKAFLSNRYIVLNIAPLGHMPYYQDTVVAINRTQAAVDINRGLEKDVANMNKHHHALEMDYVDIHSLVNDINVDPVFFNFTSVSNAYLDECDGDSCKPKDYLWWDKTHFTTAFHKQIATSILEAESYMPKAELTSSIVKQLQNVKSRFRSKKYAVPPNKGVIEQVAKLYDIKKSVPVKPSQLPLEEDMEDYEQSTINQNNTYVGLFIVILIVGGIIACIKFPNSLISNWIRNKGRGKFIPVRSEDV